MQITGDDHMELDLDVPCLILDQPKSPFQSISVPQPGPNLEEIPVEPLAIADLIVAQANDDYCRDMRVKGTFSEDERGLLVRVSPLDKVKQIVIPEELQKRCLALFHLPRISGHTG
jgi:hypothetical protein